MNASSRRTNDEGGQEVARSTAGASGGRDLEVHVDWRMTWDEWEEFRGFLWRNRGHSRYIRRLLAEGKLDGINVPEVVRKNDIKSAQ